jgi:hypothetical protein
MTTGKRKNIDKLKRSNTNANATKQARKLHKKRSDHGDKLRHTKTVGEKYTSKAECETKKRANAPSSICVHTRNATGCWPTTAQGK